MEYTIDEEKLYDDWNTLHKLPEIGFNEYKTSAFLRERLVELGFELETVAETGLIGTIRGKKHGPTVAIRADMDALKFRNEKDEIEVIHACGHDANCAMALAASAALAKKGIEAGNYIILFQPGEETMTGAQMVLESGLPHIDAMFGMHLRPQNEMEIGKATSALIHSASMPLTINFRGKAAHGARPHLGINAISAAARTITEVDALYIDTGENWSAKATVIDCMENQHNIIPEFCSVTFDIRAKSNELADYISSTIRKIASEAAQQIGCSIGIKQGYGYAPQYDAALTHISKRAIKQVLGAAEPPVYTSGSEDFHVYSVKGGIRTSYIGLGADLRPGLHAPNMCFDHSCMPNGAEILFRCVKMSFEALTNS